MNRRPSGYEPDELPDCSTPQRNSVFIVLPDPKIKPFFDGRPGGSVREEMRKTAGVKPGAGPDKNGGFGQKRGFRREGDPPEISLQNLRRIDIFPHIKKYLKYISIFLALNAFRGKQALNRGGEPFEAPGHLPILFFEIL